MSNIKIWMIIINDKYFVGTLSNNETQLNNCVEMYRTVYNGCSQMHTTFCGTLFDIADGTPKVLLDEKSLIYKNYVKAIQ